MYATQVYKNFTGLNDTSSLDSLLPNELVTAQNILFDSRGGYKKAWGRVRYATIDSNPLQSLIPFQRKDATVLKVFANGTTLYKDVAGTPTSIGTINSGKIDYFPWTNDWLYILDGTDFKRTDGTTLESVTAFDVNSNITAVKRCNIHEFYPYGFRHFYAGDTQDRFAVYFSEDSEPNKVLNTTNKVYPIANMGPVTALKAWRDSILVGYKKGWMKWTGAGVNPVTSASWRMVKASTGPTSNKAVVNVRENLVYTGEDGVYILQSADITADDNSKKISNNINRIYSKLVNKENMAAIFDGRFLLIAACDGTVNYNNIVLVADFDSIDQEGQPGWVVFTECYANDFMIVDGVIFYAHSNDGIVMKFDHANYDNDGQAMSMIAEHYITLPDRYGQLNPFAVGKVKSFLLATTQENITSTAKVTITCDYESVSFDVDLNESFVWGKEWGLMWGWVDFLAKEGKVGKKARRIKVRIENNELGEPLTVLAWGVKYRPGKTKGVKAGVNQSN